MGPPWRPTLSNRLEAAPYAQVALTRSVRDAYTMRILRRQIRTRSPAMVSNAVLLKALPREISYQAHKGQRPSASVVGFLKSRMMKIRCPNPLAYSRKKLMAVHALPAASALANSSRGIDGRREPSLEARSTGTDCCRNALCVPKTRFCNIGDEVRRGQAVM
jgi:hypothetical protein